MIQCLYCLLSFPKTMLIRQNTPPKIAWSPINSFCLYLWHRGGHHQGGAVNTTALLPGAKFGPLCSHQGGRDQAGAAPPHAPLLFKCPWGGLGYMGEQTMRLTFCQHPIFGTRREKGRLNTLHHCTGIGSERGSFRPILLCQPSNVRCF